MKLPYFQQLTKPLRAACLLKDAFKRSSAGFLTSKSIVDSQKLLGVTIPVLRFLRRRADFDWDARISGNEFVARGGKWRGVSRSELRVAMSVVKHEIISSFRLSSGRSFRRYWLSTQTAYGEEVLNKGIKVYWPLDQRDCQGFDELSGKHKVKYEMVTRSHVCVRRRLSGLRKRLRVLGGCRKLWWRTVWDRWRILKRGMRVVPMIPVMKIWGRMWKRRFPKRSCMICCWMMMKIWI